MSVKPRATYCEEDLKEDIFQTVEKYVEFSNTSDEPGVNTHAVEYMKLRETILKKVAALREDIRYLEDGLYDHYESEIYTGAGDRFFKRRGREGVPCSGRKYV